MLIGKKLTFLILLLLAGPAVAFGQGSVEIRKTDSYVRSVERITGKRTEPDLVFADAADYETEKSKWTRFASTKALDEARRDQEFFSIAYNWRIRNKLAASNFTFSSPSGDWAQYVEHYFRPDGTAALVKAELRTFDDNCVIKQKYYFDGKSRRIKQTVAYFDLNTNKPKRRCLGADALKFDYYKTVAKLPFADLLEKK